MFRWRKKKRQNMLTMVPVLKKPFRLESRSGEETGNHELVVPRTGWLERISVRWLNQPETIRVRLDPLGGFVLSRCTGDYTVEEIAGLLEARFGEEAEPILPRLVQFLRIVEANGWIQMKREP